IFARTCSATPGQPTTTAPRVVAASICKPKADGAPDGWSSDTRSRDPSRSVDADPRRSPRSVKPRKESGLQASGPQNREVACPQCAPREHAMLTAFSSPEGIRTPDLFLEREAP